MTERIKREPIPVTDEERKFRNTFVTSAFFSQGVFDLQRKYTYWLAKRGHFDGLYLPEDPPRFIKEMQLPRNHMPIGGNVSAEFARFYTGVRDIIIRTGTENPPPEARIHDITEEIAKDLVLRDDDFQMKPRYGRSATDTTPPDDSEDPHASFVRRYVLHRHMTGSEHFNALFNEVRGILLPNLVVVQNAQPETILSSRQKQLKNMISKWEANHPGTAFISQEMTQAMQPTLDPEDVRLEDIAVDWHDFPDPPQPRKTL
jgi:hypothetical protein